MAQNEFSRRVLLRNAALAGGGLLLAGACTPGPRSGGVADAAKLQGAEVIVDPARFPDTLKESPEFAKLVAEGKLPKVAERIGQDPLVLKPVEGIGKYGGQLRRGFSGVADFHNANRFCAGPDNLLYWDFRQERLLPNIARDYELSSDSRELVLHLRRGMRWSDGHPFTADDIVFWRDDINLDRSMGLGGSSALSPRGNDVAVKKIDDVTVVFQSPKPYGVLPEILAGWTDIGGQTYAGPRGGGGFAPKHYLSKFHPKYTSEAAATALAREAGMEAWPLFLLDRNTWYLNPELPTLTPWTVTRPINDPPWEFAANPYSIWVDTDGNQLPYIPKIAMNLAPDPEAISLRTVSGQYDFQDRGLQVDKLPVLVNNQERGDYTVHKAPNGTMDCTIRLNLSYSKVPEIGELIRNVDFRRALSLGINRDQINQTFFLGSSKQSAVMPAQRSPYHPGSEWKTKWATHDVKQANALLDRIGLSKKDDEGFRLLPSGAGRLRLDIESSFGLSNYPAVGEMIRKQWADIGIDATNETVEATLLIERTLTGDLMMSVITTITDDPFTLPDSFLPTVTDSYIGLIGIPYAKWFTSGGRDGEEPPASLSKLKDAMELYYRGLELGKEERIPLGQELFRTHADQVWSIGLVGFGLAGNGLYCASNRLGNVPGTIINNSPLKAPSNVMPMTLYYK